MKTEKFNELISKHKKVIVGVSGGVDSMVLLDLIRQADLEKIIVCNVNYNIRAESKEESQLVKEYCEKHNIQFEHLDLKKEVRGNIQHEARVIRLNFFRETCRKFDIKTVVLGHHLDDHLETYFLQEKRKIIRTHYGLKPVRQMKNFVIIRPLLELTKDTLYKYAKENEVPFMEDTSNKKLNYLRNEIRHNIISTLSTIKKIFYVQKIKLENRKNKKLFDKVDIIKNNLVKEGIFHSDLFSQPKDLIKILLYNFLKDNGYPPKKIDKKIINEIVNFHNKTKKTKAQIDLFEKFKLEKNKEHYKLVKGI